MKTWNWFFSFIYRYTTWLMIIVEIDTNDIFSFCINIEVFRYFHRLQIQISMKKFFSIESSFPRFNSIKYKLKFWSNSLRTFFIIQEFWLMLTFPCILSKHIIVYSVLGKLLLYSVNNLWHANDVYRKTWSNLICNKRCNVLLYVMINNFFFLQTNTKVFRRTFLVMHRKIELL